MSERGGKPGEPALLRQLGAVGPLHCEVGCDTRVTRLSPEGEFDLASAEVAANGLDQALARPTPRLVVDLRGLTFIDVSGLAFLVSAAKACGPRRLRLIRSESDQVRRVTDAIGLENRPRLWIRRHALRMSADLAAFRTRIAFPLPPKG